MVRLCPFRFENYVIAFSRLFFRQTLIPFHAVSDWWRGKILGNARQTNIDTIYSWHFCRKISPTISPTVLRAEHKKWDIEEGNMMEPTNDNAVLFDLLFCVLWQRMAKTQRCDNHADGIQ